MWSSGELARRALFDTNAVVEDDSYSPPIDESDTQPRQADVVQICQQLLELCITEACKPQRRVRRRQHCIPPPRDQLRRSLRRLHPLAGAYHSNSAPIFSAFSDELISFESAIEFREMGGFLQNLPVIEESDEGVDVLPWQLSWQ
jgi:hypothetical protein